MSSRLRWLRVTRGYAQATGGPATMGPWTLAFATARGDVLVTRLTQLARRLGEHPQQISPCYSQSDVRTLIKLDNANFKRSR